MPTSPATRSSSLAGVATTSCAPSVPRVASSTLGAPNVIRFKTGNLPNGVVLSYDGQRAYVNNEADVSVTVIT